MSTASDALRPDLEDALLGLRAGDDEAFRAVEREVLVFQREHNPVVRAFRDGGRFLPIGAFRLAHVGTFEPDLAEATFRSSGTSDTRRATHRVRRLDLARRTVSLGFERVFGAETRVVVGYLPEYAADSSLVFMMHTLCERYGATGSAVFAGDPVRLQDVLRRAAEQERSVLIVGAAFALLDLAESTGLPLDYGTHVIETGGMKTHRRSVTRDELHERLAAGFGVEQDRIGSEYGMCELTSQAWSPSGAWYGVPPWMRIAVLDPDDPNHELPDGSTGLLAVTDLANLYSASHVLTDDLAVARGDRFTIVGRADGAALRGCNFLMEPTP